MSIHKVVALGAVYLIGLYGLWKAGKWVVGHSRQRKLLADNVITIVHRGETGGVIRSLMASECISLKTQQDFLDQYEKLDHDRDIHLVIQTTGGSLSCAEAISNFILNHRGRGRVIAYVPRYAYSGGCLIAISCDHIVMGQNSIVGPCDAQLSGNIGHYSVSSIIRTVDYKREHDQKIDEQWLATAYDSTLTQERQRAYMDKLVKKGLYPQAVADRIYQELFTGKYNHDQPFMAADAKELGLKVDVVSQMPDWVLKYLSA